MTTPARSAVVLLAGMTHRDAQQAVAAVWPYVVLRLYRGTPAFYKEGLPYAEDSYTNDDDTLRPSSFKHPPPDRVLLTGGLTPHERRNRIYIAFELEPEFECRYRYFNQPGGIDLPGGKMDVRSSTLDHIQIAAEQMRAAFKAKFGRVPEPDDSFEGIIPSA